MTLLFAHILVVVGVRHPSIKENIYRMGSFFFFDHFFIILYFVIFASIDLFFICHLNQFRLRTYFPRPSKFIFRCFCCSLSILSIRNVNIRICTLHTYYNIHSIARWCARGPCISFNGLIICSSLAIRMTSITAASRAMATSPTSVYPRARRSKWWSAFVPWPRRRNRNR